MARGTLYEPPPLAVSKAPIENHVELVPVLDAGSDVFTNAHPLWHPPGFRGVFGGGLIGQSLFATQLTVPNDFTVHSMHTNFVLPGDSKDPILYHVERVRDGRNFATRTVQARQQDRPIFTATISFNKEESGGKLKVEHAAPKPDVSLPQEAWKWGDVRPFESHNAGIQNRDSSHPEDKKIRQWIRARGRISPTAGHQAHLSALAYMSDSYFIGTVARVHNVMRFSSPGTLQKALKALESTNPKNDIVRRYLKGLAEEEAAEFQANIKNGTQFELSRELGMLMSLSHSIYFHNPRAVRADDWMIVEMESPWAGEGRGLAMQKIWSYDGVLIATCVQEGVVRLKQEGNSPVLQKAKL